MREFSLPALYEVPADGNLTDLIRRNAAQHPDTAVIGRKDAAGHWEDVTAAALPRRGTGRGQGPDRLGRAARRPGRADVQDPLRVDAAGLRDLERGRASPCRCTRRRRPRRSSGSSATPARSRWSWSREPHEETVESVRVRLPHLKHVWRIDAGAVDALAAVGHGHLRRRGGRAGGGRARGLARHDRLHLGHHRPPQGLRAQPPQLLRRVRQRGGAARPALPHRRTPRCCSSCRWPTSSGGWSRWRA